MKILKKRLMATCLTAGLVLSSVMPWGSRCFAAEEMPETESASDLDQDWEEDAETDQMAEEETFSDTDEVEEDDSGIEILPDDIASDDIDVDEDSVDETEEESALEAEDESSKTAGDSENVDLPDAVCWQTPEAHLGEELEIIAEGTDSDIKDLSENYAAVMTSVRDYICQTDAKPTYGSEWYVIGLARLLPDQTAIQADSYLQTYLASASDYIAEKEGILTNTAARTDYCRTILALTALGVDASEVKGYDLFAPLDSLATVTKQGINGAIWTLIAINCHPEYGFSEETISQDQLINYILEKQLADGGWAYSGKSSDVDLTCMVIDALAPFYGNDAQVTQAVDRAIVLLAGRQNKTGGFVSNSGNNATAESSAQVLTALSALGIDAETDERFIKNGISPLDDLLTYYIEGKGFAHMRDGGSNAMATSQGMYALTAYNRLKDGRSSLYDMSDMTLNQTDLDDPEKDDPSQDDPEKDKPVIDDPTKDDPATDDPGKDKPGKDDPAKDSPGKDDPSKDKPGKDDPAKDDPSKDDPSKDNSGKDDSTKKPSNQNDEDDDSSAGGQTHRTSGTVSTGNSNSSSRSSSGSSNSATKQKTSSKKKSSSKKDDGWDFDADFYEETEVPDLIDLQEESEMDETELADQALVNSLSAGQVSGRLFALIVLLAAGACGVRSYGRKKLSDRK